MREKYYQFMILTARENEWDSGLMNVCVLATDSSEARRKAKFITKQETYEFKAFLRKYNYVKVQALLPYEDWLSKAQLLYIWHLVVLTTFHKERLDDEQCTANLICQEVIRLIVEKVRYKGI